MKILLIVAVLAIVAGAYWLLRRNVLRDKQGRQRLKRGIEAWRAGGSVVHLEGATTAASTTPASYSAWSDRGSEEAEAVATMEAAELAMQAAEAATIEPARSA